jgi:hypothetical protein
MKMVEKKLLGFRLIGPPEEYMIFGSGQAVLSSSYFSALGTYILQLGQQTNSEFTV